MIGVNKVLILLVRCSIISSPYMLASPWKQEKVTIIITTLI